MTCSGETQQPRQQDLWFLKSSQPVFIPAHPALTASDGEFEAGVCVFSDMHFNQADSKIGGGGGGGGFAGGWSSSYERIEGAFRAAGYEMPELVFWNLAGGRAGYMGGGGKDTNVSQHA